MTEHAANKILTGLREALAHARCDHADAKVTRLDNGAVRIACKKCGSVTNVSAEEVDRIQREGPPDEQ